MGRILSLAFAISRFRFWIYTGGTYVVGYALGMENWLSFFQPEYYLYLVYFFFPANVLIYGINDYWDMATDASNPKKEAKEYRFKERERNDITLILSSVALLSLALFLVQDTGQRIIFIAFLFLAYFYSAPPLRFKEIPFLDFSSNMLYIMPGIFGYYLASGVMPPVLYIAGGFFHIAAMHLFSAIPDIEYDREAGITTTAVYLGKKWSLVLCLAFWMILSVIVITATGWLLLSALVLLFPAVPAILLLEENVSIERLYWLLPYLNTGLGGLLFTVVALTKMVIPTGGLMLP
jgi:4-hydroxybenzoate polyprenyltransferase